MAMHKNLEVGSIVCYYITVDEQFVYGGYGNPRRLQAYVSLNAIYVYTRRARTNGVWVPANLKPLLESLKIKVNESIHRPNQVQAIGCEARSVRRETLSESEISYDMLMYYQRLPEALNFGETFKETDFVKEFLLKQKNSAKKGLLVPPKEQLQHMIQIPELKELNPDDDIWSSSRWDR